MSLHMSPVQKTAFDAASRKVHTVAKGYIEDPFIHFFAHDHTMINSPLMNRGYWLRTKAFENTIVNFASLFPEGQAIQVVNLGCGFDTLFFRWSAQPALSPSSPPPNGRVGPVNIAKFLELDVAEMVAAKRHIIQKNETLTKVTAQHSGVYQLAACDLADPSAVTAAFQAAGLDPALPTIAIAECVLVYLTADDSTALLRQLTAYFTPAPVASTETASDSAAAASSTSRLLLATYDMIGPDDRFGQMMIENLRKMGLDIHSIDAIKTPQDHERRALAVGFRSAKALTMKALYLSVARETQLRLNRIELIDDWDEWGIVHGHYCFALCYTGPEPLPVVFPGGSTPTFGSFEK